MYPSEILILDIDIVFLDKLMGLYHGSLGLVFVSALRQCQQLFDTDEKPVVGICIFIVQTFSERFIPPGGSRIGTQQVTGFEKVFSCGPRIDAPR